MWQYRVLQEVLFFLTVQLIKNRQHGILNHIQVALVFTGLSKKMDGILNRYNLKSTGRIYTFGILKCSEKFKVLDLS